VARNRLPLALFTWLTSLIALVLLHTPILRAVPNDIKVIRYRDNNSAEIFANGQASPLHTGERLGPWSLMAIVDDDRSKPAFVILEDFSQQTGHLLFVDQKGVRLDLPKSLEPTSQDPANLYLGHTLDEIVNSPTDLLADQILAKPGDPNYDEVASVFPPIRKIPTYSFVGTNTTMDKVGFAYGGRSPNFDPAPYYGPISKIRDQGRVLDGLVGGYLPILRFVYPESPEVWTEMLAFAPLRMSNGNDRVQPVWYRLVHIEQGSVKWTHYIDSYHPFPPRTDDPKVFYRDLADLNSGWNKLLAPAMKIEIPDVRIANLARFSLVRDLMTHVDDFPKYGAVDKDYAGSEHDGFPDTFNVDTTAMLDWGLIDAAGRFIDNYFGKFVRDDGSLLYRGPETGQYGRMLTVLAQFANYGGDPAILLRQRKRIDGVTNLLLHLRNQARQLPPDSPAYGMISGWSEADASLDADPPRYMQPYFSNSAEAARGFHDLGEVWARIGKRRKDVELMAWGASLIREAGALQYDMQSAISKSLLKLDGETILPSIAGVTEPFHIVVPRDPSDPQFRSYRAYMEMLYSGLLTKEQVEFIVHYRARHHDIILGVPTAYGFKTGAMAGFLAYGHGYGLIQHDMTREGLLLLYSITAHNYTRGTWLAPETRPTFDTSPAAPYCTPAQLVVPMMTKWMLVFEDPLSETLWLDKATPRQWLDDGLTISVSDAPTRWGRIGFSVTSHLAQHNVTAIVHLRKTFPATAKLRVRTPGQLPLKYVTLNGKPWKQFSAEEETITIPPNSEGEIKIVAEY
jgi:hypothetical protein